ncbi:MAG: protein tyrosine phosphatase [Clostridia bacterium]|nr:protein tyrosine phosphatase [Clostridia bacterium]
MVISIKILFICSRNKWRSLTAEKIFQGIHGYSIRSAGTENNARVKVTAGHIGWADLIFVMEKKHIRRLQDMFGNLLSEKKVICLGISDEYTYMDPELVEILKSQVSQYIHIPEGF